MCFLPEDECSQMVTAYVIVLRLVIPVESCLSLYSGVTYEPVPIERGGRRRRASSFFRIFGHAEASRVFRDTSKPPDGGTYLTRDTK